MSCILLCYLCYLLCKIRYLVNGISNVLHLCIYCDNGSEIDKQGNGLYEAK
jgi:hypothetical protein